MVVTKIGLIMLVGILFITGCAQEVSNPAAQTPNCDDNDPCTIDSYDPANNECIHTPKNCDDANPNTFDSCNPSTGECIHLQG